MASLSWWIASGFAVALSAGGSPTAHATDTTSNTAAPVAGEVAPASGGLSQVTRGVTTQAELLRLFGGPNLTSVDPTGREVWVYERAITQTNSASSSKEVGGNIDFSAFFSIGNAGVAASKSSSSQTQSTGSSIRTVTAIVTFAPNHTVADYTVTANYF